MWSWNSDVLTANSPECGDRSCFRVERSSRRTGGALRSVAGTSEKDGGTPAQGAGTSEREAGTSKQPRRTSCRIGGSCERENRSPMQAGGPRKLRRGTRNQEKPKAPVASDRRASVAAVLHLVGTPTVVVQRGEGEARFRFRACAAKGGASSESRGSFSPSRRLYVAKDRYTGGRSSEAPPPHQSKVKT